MKRTYYKCIHMHYAYLYCIYNIYIIYNDSYRDKKENLNHMKCNKN